MTIMNLSHRKQRTRVNDSYSESLAVMFWVPQGSILGQLLFNIFLAVLFFIHSDTDIASFADDNTPYLSAKIVEVVIESLERDSVSLFRWFENNLLIWKCHSRKNNRKINRLHERCLRTMYNDKQSSFNELLEKDGSVSIHERNLQVLATEMHKISNGLSTPLMKDIFPIRRNLYNLRENSVV